MAGAVSVALTNEQRTLGRWGRTLAGLEDDCTGARTYIERHLIPNLQCKIEELFAEMTGLKLPDGEGDEEEGMRSPSDTLSFTDSSRSASRMSHLNG